MGLLFTIGWCILNAVSLKKRREVSLCKKQKISSWYSTVAGALFAFGGVMELFQWLRILRFMSFSDYVQMLIWVASCAVLAFALLTKRRDIFLPVASPWPVLPACSS